MFFVNARDRTVYITEVKQRINVMVFMVLKDIEISILKQHFIQVIRCIWGVSRQLPQRAAREPQIVLFLTHVYDTKMYFKKLFDKCFRRIFFSAFQRCRQFFRNFPFSPSKTLSYSIARGKHRGHSLENILSCVKNAQLSI